MNVEEMKTNRDVLGLIKALEDKDAQWASAAALGEIGDKRAVKPLIRALTSIGYWETIPQGCYRARVAKSLGEIGDEIAIDPLIVALRDRQVDVRIAAAEALGKIGGIQYLIRALKDEDQYVRQVAVIVLSEEIKNTQAVEPLIKVLDDVDSDIRYRAAAALGKIRDKRAIEPLIKALKDKDSDVRGAVAEGLGKIGDSKAVKPLIEAFKDFTSDRYYRNRIAESLGMIGKPAVEHLIKSLKYRNSYVREGGAKALGEIGDKRAIEPLIKALKDEYSNVRSAAAEALVSIGQPAVEPLIGALKDEKWYVREYASEALGNIGNKRAIDPLAEALKDEDWHVREAAEEALKKIKAKKS